jgi:hypothetical protein
MSKTDKRSKEQEVGYGQPPTSSQFKKGQSGNPKGRPKKKDPSCIDLSAILTREVQVNGKQMDAREVELRQQVKKALDPKGSLKSLRHVIEMFEKHGAMKPPTPKRNRMELPSTKDFPWAVQEILLRQGLVYPWTQKQIKAAKASYLEGRNDGDQIYDKLAGHEEWLMS